MLNRAAMILRPAQPYLDWALPLDHEGMVPDPADEQTVYLVPQFEHDEDEHFLSFLEQTFDEFFTRELFGWHTVEDDWPQNRTVKMFREWFRIELHSCGEECLAAPLEDDDDCRPRRRVDRRTRPEVAFPLRHEFPRLLMFCRLRRGIGSPHHACAHPGLPLPRDPECLADAALEQLRPPHRFAPDLG